MPVSGFSITQYRSASNVALSCCGPGQKRAKLVATGTNVPDRDELLDMINENAKDSVMAESSERDAAGEVVVRGG